MASIMTTVLALFGLVLAMVAGYVYLYLPHSPLAHSGTQR